MPVVDIEVNEGVVDDAQKAKMIGKAANAMVDAESKGAQNIRRCPDGSIDLDHYDRIARGLRAHDQRAALALLIAPAHSLLRMLWKWLLGQSVLVSYPWWLRLYRDRFSAHSRR